MRIFVSAAEISSDLHAEKILRALLARYPNEKIEVFGIGGPQVRSVPGFRTIEKAENLRAMGLVEVLSKIKKIKSIRDRVLEALKATPPNLVLTLDYPDFHFSLMKAWSQSPESKAALKICGIPPKVWVWRSRRVERIRSLYDGVWVIFPFEKNFYESHRIPVIYEGNPIIADWVSHDAPAALASAGNLQLAVMPGSREAELKYHLPLIPETLERLADLSGRKVVAQVPIPAGVESEWIKSELLNSDQVTYQFFHNGTLEVLKKNAIGLVKSGTSTLEAAVLGCVPVIFYKVHPFTEWFFRIFVRYSGAVGLPNILLGVKKRAKSVFVELIGIEADSESMALELWRLVQNREEFEEKRKQGMSLRAALVPHANVPAQIAAKMSEWIKKKPLALRSRSESRWVALVSLVWSSVNGVRRKLLDWGLIASRPLSLPSILVGNLQAGGTGKTPVVIELAKDAIARGYRVGIISRGYRGKFKERCLLVTSSTVVEIAGDEAIEMARAVPQAKIALSKDRHLASEMLKDAGVNLLILDDGFQNLSFRADITLVLVTDADPSQMVYRDFLSVSRKADFLLQTKGPRTIQFGESLPRVEWEVNELPSSPVWLLCGVGDPFEVESFYRARGLNILRVTPLSDHIAPNQNFIKKWMEEARASGLQPAVTEKDWVKIEHLLSRDQVLVLKRSMVSREWLKPIFERLQRVVETRKL